jgi:hypothetical protein
MAQRKLTRIQNMIYEIRGQKVILDCDLAQLYEVPTHRLNEAVKRNAKRFPSDFMFQLTADEWKPLLISQFAISKDNRGGRRTAPFVFSEQGIAMLSGILNSDIAVDVNINIMRAFVKLRHYVLSQSKDEQIAELRKLLMLYIEKNDRRVNEIIIALNNLIEQPPKPKTIGFRAD